MSRRRSQREAGGTAPGEAGGGLGTLARVGVLALAFAAGVAVAELAGAANLGVAFGVGQLTFVIALVLLLLRS